MKPISKESQRIFASLLFMIPLLCLLGWNNIFAKTTVWFIRHGQTDWNLEKRIQGHTDTPLNVQGQEQANAIAHIISLNNTKTPFNAIYRQNILNGH